MALSANDLMLMRTLIADQSATPTFSDDLLNAFYTFTSQSFFLTVAYVFRTLQANATMFSSYTAGMTSESKDQVYNHLEQLATHYEDWNSQVHQVKIVGMRAVPPRRKARPYLQGQGTSYQNAYLGIGKESIDNTDIQSGGSFLK